MKSWKESDWLITLQAGYGSACLQSQLLGSEAKAGRSWALCRCGLSSETLSQENCQCSLVVVFV